jgi:multidrug efflux pump
MASAVAAPLEKQFGHIAGVTEMTSSSYLGTTGITLQFDLNRNIDGAARDVQAAINAARSYLPANLPSNPTWRKVNPADSPIMIIALTSDIYDRGQMYDAASSDHAARLSQVEGVGQVVRGRQFPAGRAGGCQPGAIGALRIGLTNVKPSSSNANANRPRASFSDDKPRPTSSANDQLMKAEYYRPLVSAITTAPPSNLQDVADVEDSVRTCAPRALATASRRHAHHFQTAASQHYRHGGPRPRGPAVAEGLDSPGHEYDVVTLDRTTTIRASVMTSKSRC